MGSKHSACRERFATYLINYPQIQEHQNDHVEQNRRWQIVRPTKTEYIKSVQSKTTKAFYCKPVIHANPWCSVVIHFCSLSYTCQSSSLFVNPLLHRLSPVPGSQGHRPPLNKGTKLYFIKMLLYKLRLHLNQLPSKS